MTIRFNNANLIKFLTSLSSQLAVLCLLIILGSNITGCSNTKNYAPVVPPVQKISDENKSFYLIKRGDTLYSIAQQRGVNYKALALWNKIPPPYKLLVGQKIRLFQAKQQKIKKKEIKKTVKKKKKSANNTNIRNPSQNKTKGKRRISQNKSTHINQKKKLLKLQWKWPVNGTIFNNFSQTGKKGIEITGKIGQQVRSAASGKVVYSGSGLKGYDNLLIIKHNATYLSTYANNRLLLVKEGELVKGGQVIAEMGRGGNKQPSLHFEIRKNGSPVNPLFFLPNK